MKPILTLIEAITKKVNSLMDGYDALLGENIELEKSNSHLKALNEQYKTDKTKLEQKMNNLIAQNAQLRTEIAGLKKVKLQNLTDKEQENLNALIGDYLVDIDKCITLIESLEK